MSSAAERIFQDTLDVIRYKSKRDGQKRVGPSDIGNPCDRCLGLALAGILSSGGPARPDEFSWKAWTGTAMHEKLERDRIAQQGLVEGWKLEGTVRLGKLKGYGKVKGHVDVMVVQPASILLSEGAQIIDYKSIDIAPLRKLKLANSIPEKYRVQLHCYGYGAEQEGIEVADVSNFFFARDHNNLIEASWRYTEPYDRKIVLKAFKRVEALWADFVSKGKVELLRSHPECFVCSRTRRVSFKEV